MDVLRNELKSKITNLPYNDFNIIYNELIILDTYSNFNKDEFRKFFVIISYLGSGKKIEKETLDMLLSNINKVADEKLNKLAYNFEKINPGWLQYDSLKNQNSRPKYSSKIYLSVDNSSLHMFANDLLMAALDNNYDDLSFKINADESINRRDNVVIYCTDDNLEKYINLVNSIVIANPNIKYNQPHLLGIPITDQIRVGIDFENGDVSFTDGICKKISAGLKNGKTAEDIANTIYMYQEKNKVLISSLLDQEKKNIIS